MSAILAQIALAFGLIMFIISVVVGFVCEVEPLVIVFRAIVVMCVSTVVLSVLFRYFVSIIYQFMAQKILDQNRAHAAKVPGATKSGATGVAQ